jgi:hypothetical protein
MSNDTQAPQGIFHCAEHRTLSPLGDRRWVASGECRCPREGEWYLHVGKRLREARRAHEDMPTEEWIAVDAPDDETPAASA